jgi:pimeloyl-ACP methyl ester carboxylesterase
LPCLAIGLLACFGCQSLQRRLIYFPPVFDHATAEQFGRTAHLRRWLNSSGNEIGWQRPSQTLPAAGQALVLHGNASAAIQYGHYADILQQIAPLDVFILEYPGYADRPGEPMEHTIEQAADEALQLLDTSRPSFIVAESLGTGVACYLAGAHSNLVSGVALLAPYTSLTDVARFHAPILPVGLILCDRYPAREYLRSYHGPVAILVGGKDRVVPAKFGLRLYADIAGPKRLWEFPECDHGTLMEQPLETWRQIYEFWASNRR